MHTLTATEVQHIIHKMPNVCRVSASNTCNWPHTQVGFVPARCPPLIPTLAPSGQLWLAGRSYCATLQLLCLQPNKKTTQTKHVTHTTTQLGVAGGTLQQWTPSGTPSVVLSANVGPGSTGGKDICLLAFPAHAGGGGVCPVGNHEGVLPMFCRQHPSQELARLRCCSSPPPQPLLLSLTKQADTKWLARPSYSWLSPAC
jgi:hypothetical protein